MKYMKYKYFENGIPAHLFRKERMSDIKEIMEISRAVKNKNKSNGTMFSEFG